MNRSVLMPGILICMSASALAAVTPSALFTRGMVLQRDREIPVWGKADAGEKVTVSFAGESVSSTADAAGNWLVKLPAKAGAKEGRTLTIAGSNTIALEDVVVGDVFLYSGGNEAEAEFRSPWAPKGDWVAAEQAKCLASTTDIRLFRSKLQSSLVRVECVNAKSGPWFRIDDPKRGGKGTPIAAWLFASRWTAKTGLPCGIVSGAGIWRYFQDFMSPGAWAYFPGCEEYPKPEIKLNEHLAVLRGLVDFGRSYAARPPVKGGEDFATDTKIDTKTSFGGEFNAMIVPLLKFSYRGAVFVDPGRPGYIAEKEWEPMIRALLDGWRELAASDFPGALMGSGMGDWTACAEKAVAELAAAAKPEPPRRLFEPKDPPSAKGLDGRFLVSAVFGDHMVLQRGKPHPVWGKAKPGAVVKVSYQSRTAEATADAAGDWTATLPPLSVQKTGLDLVVACGGETKVFADVLCGDVWYAAGQSNAEMSFNWVCLRGDETIAEAAKYPQIRTTKFDHWKSLVPVKFQTSNKEWRVCDAKGIAGCSAAGYYFARRITIENDGLPIGILDNNWSGSAIEPFIPLDGMRAEPYTAKSVAGRLALVEKTAAVGAAAGRRLEAGETLLEAFRDDGVFRPVANPDWCSQYNIMNGPIEKLPITGVTWYQGCSNKDDGPRYRDLMRALVKGWRRRMGFDMPFYQVQLASFYPGKGLPEGGDGYAAVREAQREVSDRLPNFGTATAIDVGNEKDIHPKNKWDVGERLALWALRDVYGKKDIVVSGPWFERMTLEGAKARIHFRYVGSGLMAADKNPDGAGEMPKRVEKLVGFSLQGADGKWHFADSVIDGDTVVVSSPEVAEAKNVRYAYRASILGVAHPQCRANLYNREGLPALPFKTDPW